MQQLRINGGNRLVGEVRASGAKNAALPILAAALLTADDLVLHNVPDLADVRTMLKLLEGMGVKVTRSGTDVTLNAGNVTSTKAPYELVKTMRASVLTLCPLAARFGSAEVSLLAAAPSAPAPWTSTSAACASLARLWTSTTDMFVRRRSASRARTS